MDKKYYRVLNPLDEPSGKHLPSNRMSDFRREVFAYRKLSHCIYIFALKTGIQVGNAVRVAENVPAFLDILNPFFQSGKPYFQLMDIGVNDSVKEISGDDLYNFVSNYIEEINVSGLFYDWGKDHYFWEFAWEMVRNFEFPNIPSRMDSVFLFTDEDVARTFQTENRDLQYKLVNVDLQEGVTEEFDMNWFTDVPSDITLSEVQEYARKYWSQQMSDNPIIEVLHKGIYTWN